MKLKKAEIAQLEAERVAVVATAESLSSVGGLSYAVVSADAVTQFLSKLDGYKLFLDHPRGAVATIDTARINFADGVPEAFIEAEATDKHHLIRIKLRVVSDVCVTAAGSDLHLRFVPLEILPALKVSIFRWHEFWFIASLLRIKADDYAASMPDVVIPIKSAVHLDLDTKTETDMAIGQVHVPAKEVFPDHHLVYTLGAKNVAILHDGIHVFLSLDRASQ